MQSVKENVLFYTFWIFTGYIINCLIWFCSSDKICQQVSQNNFLPRIVGVNKRDLHFLIWIRIDHSNMKRAVDYIHPKTGFGCNHVPRHRVQLLRPLVRKVACGAELVQGVAVRGARQDHQGGGDIGVGSVGAGMGYSAVQYAAFTLQQRFLPFFYVKSWSNPIAVLKSACHDHSKTPSKCSIWWCFGWDI